MAKVVYLLGAGINQGVTDWDGLRPPLASDFFQQALRHHRIGDSHYLERVKSVFEFIAEYWHLSIDQLRTEPFDLEECFTLLQLQAIDASQIGDERKYIELLQIERSLTVMLAEYLQEFEMFPYRSEAFRAFGQMLYDERPAIITFNYDILVESAIESASGVREHVPDSYRGHFPDGSDVPDDLLPYSHCVWNRPLAYGVRFDEVTLQQAGISTRVAGDRFYSHAQNRLYEPPLLKLHGSLNWFVYTGIQRHPVFHSDRATKRGQTLIYQGHHWFNEPIDVDGEIVEPIVITPVLHKNISANALISQLWERARRELAECEQLVVGGYSFPPTDFHTKRLFLEAFKDRSPEQLTVVNPDPRVIELVKRLCSFTRPVLSCCDLDEFVELYRRGFP